MAEDKRIMRNVSMYQRDWEAVESLDFGNRGRSMALRTIVRQWRQYTALAYAVVHNEVTDEEVRTRLRELACY